MPFVLSDEDKQKQGEEQQAQGQNISGSSSSFNVNVPGQTAKAGGQKASGQFQNIQKYLQANEGQAQQMGEKLASNVESQIGQAKQETSKLAGEVQKVKEFDPYATLKNLPQANKGEYQAFKTTGGYSGPQDVYGLGSYGAATTAQQKAKTGLELAGSETGQQELLKQQYQRPSYSKGQTSLDQALMQKSEGGRAALENLRQRYSGINELLQGQMGEIKSDLAKQQELAKSNIARFQPAEEKAQQELISPLEQRAAQINKEQPELYKTYTEDIKDNYIDPSTMQALGLEYGKSKYGIDLSKYFTPPTGEASLQNVATQEELNRYNDLMNFLGTNTGLLPTQAIGYTGTQVNKEQLAKDIASKEAEYQNFLKTNAGRAMYIDPGTNQSWSGSGLESNLASALANKNISEIEQWYNSLPDSPMKRSYQYQQVKNYLDKFKTDYNVNDIISGNLPPVVTDQQPIVSTEGSRARVGRRFV